MKPYDWNALLEDLVVDDAQVQAERDAEAKRYARKLREETLSRVRECGVRRRAFEAATSPALEETDALRHVRELTGPGIWLLAGGVGCGKTVAATWWLIERARNVFPLFITAEKLEAAGRYDDVVRAQWENATAIVLDDLGVEYADQKGHFGVVFEALIDHVCGEMRQMIITTNLQGGEFVARYGERIASRIREAGGFLGCAGHDRRRDDSR